MEDKNVFTGKTVDEALDLGLKALGLTLGEVEYEVLEEGKRRLFGSVKAMVRITPKGANKPEKPVAKPLKTETGTEAKADIKHEGKKVAEKSQKPEKKRFEKTENSVKAEKTDKPVRRSEGTPVDPIAFIDGLLEQIGVEGKSVIVKEEDGLLINITAESSARVIGKHGDVLDAIQCIAGAVANIGREEYTKVVVDCENYREQREQTLKDLAAKIAAKAVETGRKIILEPMSPYERRIIHASLSDSTEVRTASEGREPVRSVVVIPFNMRPGDRGIRYGERRGDRRRDDRRGRRDDRRRDDRRDGDRPARQAKSGKKEIHFGTFLGNSNENKTEE